ncbi:nucleotide pyrophosphatase/phosphodiesterase family protein [Flagellimonas sp. DF-77]|uniref:alkaline phosphatase family protein n=1 Tax=Flagellimonas algarum TaxID=3230298 RepID=UPI003393697D
MKKTVVINVVGLSPRLIGEHTPFIKSFMDSGTLATVTPVVPAVTCTAQSTYLTGTRPATHGIVGNGWYFKDECEVKFWRQSNKLVTAPKLWEQLKSEDPEFTCANHFWWYNMYSTVDFSVTPRPNYLADGRKIPDVYSHPADLRTRLQNELGTFPLFNFWGPKTSIASSRWIADAAMLTDTWHDPTLTLIYLPHLDYNIQRHGVDFKIIAKDLNEIDEVVEGLVTYYREKETQVVLLSEYGITDVDRPVHLNRVFREQGWLATRVERGLELLDCGASQAFAVADHQLAHIYLNDRSIMDEVIAVLQATPGVEQVWTASELVEQGLAHSRSGDIVVVSDNHSWFTYYFWTDDAKAPDYARMVDIHKKPGYDPVEMFVDPKDPFVMPKILWKLLKKKMGFRTVMDVIPLQAELVKGSHGRIPDSTEDYPVFMTDVKDILESECIEATEVFSNLLRILNRPT